MQSAHFHAVLWSRLLWRSRIWTKQEVQNTTRIPPGQEGGGPGLPVSQVSIPSLWDCGQKGGILSYFVSKPSLVPLSSPIIFPLTDLLLVGEQGKSPFGDYFTINWGSGRNAQIFHQHVSYSVIATVRSGHRFHLLNSHVPVIERGIRIHACITIWFSLYHLCAARIHFQSSEKSLPSVNLIIA